MTDWTTIDRNRREAADREWENYDFSPSEMDEMSGWEYTSGSSADESWSRQVFFVPSEEPEGDTVKGHFTVRFAHGTAEVKEAYGMINGNYVGRRPTDGEDAPAP